VGDVQELPFEDARFDCAVAAWVLYHAADLDLTLHELRRVLRPDGRLVAGTSSERNLAELWQLVGEIGAGASSFTSENGEETLRRYFPVVERRDVEGTVTFPGRQSAYLHMSAAITNAHLADRLPELAGPLVATRRVSVFVADR
jgi:SAM-dependent methyltransferase